MTTLRERRKAAKVSQEVLAQRIGRSLATVRLYEGGARIPAEMQEKIDDVLGPSHKAHTGSSVLLPSDEHKNITSASSHQERPVDAIEVIQAAVMQLLADNREIKESINKLADAILKAPPKPKTRK